MIKLGEYLQKLISELKSVNTDIISVHPIELNVVVYKKNIYVLEKGDSKASESCIQKIKFELIIQ